jgi:ADP-L-glycero-D-manno-heptose 6-epimerase
MIVVTGAAGFIGSYFVGKLNRNGFRNLILVDTFEDNSKENNLKNKRFTEQVDRGQFFQWMEKHHHEVEIVFHLGARTDTIGQEPEIYEELNLKYSQKLWQCCTLFRIPLIYASSAATYGNGDFGFSDCHDRMPDLKPLNLYAWSKHDFDIWALKQKETPAFWAGLKFFNVYGPNEYHKGGMASVVLHAYNRIRTSGEMELFRSHRDDINDGEQKRDFIYVDDIADVMLFFMENQEKPGIYNVGTGKARSYLDLTRAVFNSMSLKADIRFVDTPIEIRNRYQYFTEADIKKLREVGYSKPFRELENGVGEYVSKYLMPELTY